MLCVALDALFEFIVRFSEGSTSVPYKILSVFISRNMSVYACIAAVIVMCGNLSQSLRSGLDRILGTLLGGVSGIAFLFIKERFIPLDTVILPLGVMLLIYFLTLINRGELVPVTLTVFFITMINGDNLPHIYVTAKVFATVLGTVVSLSVNRIIKGEKHYEEKI